MPDGVLDSLDVGLLRDMPRLSTGPGWCAPRRRAPRRHVLLTLLCVAHGLTSLVALNCCAACVAHGEEELVEAAEARVRWEEHAGSKRRVRLKEIELAQGDKEQKVLLYLLNLFCK
jgi:hypothetical protein